MNPPAALYPPARKVTFVYLGQLETRGRLLKQIATLQQAGVACDLFLGNTDDRVPEPSRYSFPIQVLPVDQQSGKLASFLNQMSFGRRAGKAIAASDCDTVVCIALECLMAGVWARSFRPSLRLVFDNNELHIEAYGKGLKATIWRPLHNHAVGRCDVILHAEANRLEHFRKHYPGRNIPQLVIENFPTFIESPPDRHPPDREVRVIYLGGFGTGRFTEEIIEAFARFPPSLRLDIVGYGRPDYVELMRRRLAGLGVDHVRLLPPVPYAKIATLLREHHIGVALYRNLNLNNYYCAPNKVYDYLMSGMPVITNNYPGLRAVIEENRVGVCIDKVDGPTVRAAIERIVAARLWENITPEVRRRYSWEYQESRYLAVFGH